MTSTHVSAPSGVFPGPTLITGSGGGVGLALAEFLLESRRGPIFWHFRPNGDEVKVLLKRYDLDPERYSFQADLLNENQIRELRTHMESQVGPAWGLINLPGGSASSLSWKLTRDEFSKVMNDNLLTTFLCFREFIPGMRERGQSRIINTSSVVAFSGVAGAAHYLMITVHPQTMDLIRGLNLRLGLRILRMNV